MEFVDAPPLSLYIHIPWCVRKCPYCDFNSHQVKGEVPEWAYIAALLRDLTQELPHVDGRPIMSIFLGGGTPSLLSAEAVRALLTGVRERVALAADVEVTLESNPGTVTESRLHAYREAGVTRLSIGIQSFRERQLRVLGRIHSGDEAIAAYHAARKAGFDNVNLDLMFGLPEDSISGAIEDLATATALGPEHLSWYQLTIEPNTAFYHCPPALPDDDELWAMQQQGQALLAARGYEQYEISAYARQGRVCRHNLNYWQFGDYLGIGAGAHGKITDRQQQRILRIAKRKHPRDFTVGAGTTAAADEHVLEPRQAVVEFMMNALRLSHGFVPSLFTARTGLPGLALDQTLTDACQRGLLDRGANRIQPTALGYRYLNDLVYLFYQDEALFTGAVPA